MLLLFFCTVYHNIVLTSVTVATVDYILLLFCV